MRALAGFVATVVFVGALPASSSAYTVQEGDTLSAIAGRMGASVAELVQANGLTDPNLIVVGQNLQAPTSTATAQVSSSYTVQRGDTLTGIAGRMGVSVAELARANRLTDPNLIVAGQVLQLPGVAAKRDISAYSQLGAWVDVYDFAPAFSGGSGAPQLSPASVDAMAAAGIRTLYLQASINSSKASGTLEAPNLLGAFLTRAHARGMKVVAWYAPSFVDVGADLQRLRAMRDFQAGGRGFDGLAVDIETTAGVPDTADRNAALIELSRRLRAETGTALGAIVLPPVLLEVVNRNYWPEFPWQGLAPYYDVWLPMAYWTDRTTASGYNDARRYTSENITRLRADLGQPNAAVHVIGGIGGSSTTVQYRAFASAARQGGAVGISLYDFRATGAAVWPVLAGG